MYIYRFAWSARLVFNSCSGKFKCSGKTDLFFRQKNSPEKILQRSSRQQTSMCPKKLNYAAGDDLMLYATPKEAMRESRRRMEEEKQKRQKKYEMRMPSNQRVDPSMHTPPPSLPMVPTTSPALKNSAMPYSQAAPYYDPRQIPPPQMTLSAKRSSPTNRMMPRSRPPPISSQTVMTPPPPAHRVVSSPPVMSSPSTLSSSRSSQEALEETKDVQVAMQLFANHDVKGKGRLTAEELQNLLQNDDNSHFCISAIDALINLFGASRFGTINQSEFVSLYKRVKNWRRVYVDNDINGSFTISVSEFHNSLQELGYQVPFEVSERLFDQYAEFMNQTVNGKELKFDKFVEALVWLMRLTKVFRKFDINQEGIATIHYKDFIDETLYLGRFLPR